MFVFPGRHGSSLRLPRKVQVALLGLLVLGLGFSASHRQMKSGNDFPIYREAAATILEGESPYDLDTGLSGYVYLPFTAFLVSPLTLVPERAAIWIWYLVNVVLTFAAFQRTRFLLERAFGRRAATWGTAVAFVVLFRFFLDNFEMGQVNILILVLALAAIDLALVREKSVWAGACVGALVAIKPYGVILLLPFLLRGRWRTAFAAGGAFLAVTVLLPVMTVGPDLTAELLRGWYAKIVVPSLEGDLQGASIWDQSPQAALRRLVVGEVAFEDVRVNLFSASEETYRRLVRGLQIALWGIFLAAWLRGRRDPGYGSTLIDLALACLGMVVLVGYNLRAHFVILLLPWALIAARLRFPGGIARRRTVRAAALAAAAFVFLSVPGLVGRTASNWMLAYSAITVATLVSAALLLAIRWMESAPADPTGD